VYVNVSSVGFTPNPLSVSQQTKKALTKKAIQHGRLPYYNVAVSTEGQEHVPSVVGPLTRSLGALIDVTSIVIDSEPWKLDPKCINMPWNAKAFNDVLSRPLTIGVIWDDGVVKVHPPIARALREFVEKAKNSGHEVIDWDPVGHDTCIKIQVGLPN
jgi:amidase